MHDWKRFDHRSAEQERHLEEFWKVLQKEARRAEETGEGEVAAALQRLMEDYHKRFARFLPRS
ncbi:hypothetical protein [Deinococcus sp. NW-56]|uniref:hypothetical protein n=1 Tax=Deinococcus sp. NW-56 TaxID=2080419 RepID=UPI000CF57E15|nr:hypothetical protein [Deinococcus sp. NW-56]